MYVYTVWDRIMNVVNYSNWWTVKIFGYLFTWKVDWKSAEGTEVHRIIIIIIIMLKCFLSFSSRSELDPPPMDTTWMETTSKKAALKVLNSCKPCRAAFRFRLPRQINQSNQDEHLYFKHVTVLKIPEKKLSWELLLSKRKRNWN